ncbi:DUF3343 domain-containing protein [Tissierella pigra]|uniref:DUF3343 domain-containing protein n=1 Tax=Tissierella pigra TaxID=2607614 RepID=A0A6N7XHZ7_9FIRM|nr:DUF3343 domain-containing protein [Tissierella pigra]MBU5428347.1 DUF3343 domain-containing protein [Tissierella pigra]MSU01671.1 DUF3343 domain-containing protein [Tissierella pigra]
MRKETYGVTTYQSTHHTIQAEGVFKENGISFRTIPTPREITVSCGLAIIFALDDLPKVKDMVSRNDINIDSIYKYTKSESGNEAEKID